MFGFVGMMFFEMPTTTLHLVKRPPNPFQKTTMCLHNVKAKKQEV